MIAIIDYDAGNIKSVEKALEYLGCPYVVTEDEKVIRQADKLILPGVGAFGDAMNNIKSRGLDGVIKEVVAEGKPFLGICLGLQLLFEDSEESPGVEGLGLLKGHVFRFPEMEGYKIPQIGWNSLHLQNEGRLFAGMDQDPYVYFVHSYYLKADEREIVKASCNYGLDFDASVEKGNIFACQFHPEKSSSVGLAMLKRFADL